MSALASVAQIPYDSRMLPLCPDDPEAHLQRVLAAYSRHDPQHQRVLDGVQQIQALAKHGFGSVTLRWRDGVLYTIEAQPIIMFPSPAPPRRVP